jgi:hypothetical protein
VAIVTAIVILSAVILALLAGLVVVIVGEGRCPPKSEPEQSSVNHTEDGKRESEHNPRSYPQTPENIRREIAAIDASIKRLREVDPVDSAALIDNLLKVRTVRSGLLHLLEEVPTMGGSFEDLGFF